jgi:hypothetical protein
MRIIGLISDYASIQSCLIEEEKNPFWFGNALFERGERGAGATTCLLETGNGATYARFSRAYR